MVSVVWWSARLPVEQKVRVRSSSDTLAEMTDRSTLLTNDPLIDFLLGIFMAGDIHSQICYVIVPCLQES